MSYEIIDHNRWRIGEKQPLELNRAVPGGRVEMFAIPDEEYPGGWFYRLQYYHVDGEILRYDNAHDDTDLGWHHRHVRFGDDTEIPFHGIIPHITRFRSEIAELTDTEDSIHD